MTTNQQPLINQTFNQFNKFFSDHQSYKKISASYKASWEEFQQTPEINQFLEESKLLDQKLSTLPIKSVLFLLKNESKTQVFFFHAFIFRCLQRDDKPKLLSIITPRMRPRKSQPPNPTKEDNKKDLIIQDLSQQLAQKDRLIQMLISKDAKTILDQAATQNAQLQKKLLELEAKHKEQENQIDELQSLIKKQQSIYAVEQDIFEDLEEEKKDLLFEVQRLTARIHELRYSWPGF